MPSIAEMVLFSAALLGVGLALLIWQKARLAARVIAQFLITIALPLLLVATVAVMLVRPLLPDLDPRVSQAMIAGLVIAIGWLTTTIFAELENRRERAEKLRDTHKALYAEIGTTLDGLLNHEEHVSRILQRMSKEKDYMPFIPREKHDYVYDAVLERLEVLPRQTIDAIVAYYSQVKSVTLFAEDLRSDWVARAPQETRILMYKDYIQMRIQAFRFGMHALALIKAYSDGGVKGAEAVITEAANNQGGAQFARSQGSE